MRYLLVVQHAVRFGRHAIDAPLGVPVLIAYRDGEPAIVRPYQMDQLALAALDLQRLALASVCGVVPLCNRKCDSLFSFRPKLMIRSDSYNFTHATVQLAANRMQRLYARDRISRTQPLMSVAAASHPSASASRKPPHGRKSWRIGDALFTDGIILLWYLIYSHGCIFAVYILVSTFYAEISISNKFCIRIISLMKGVYERLYEESYILFGILWKYLDTETFIF